MFYRLICPERQRVSSSVNDQGFERTTHKNDERISLSWAGSLCNYLYIYPLNNKRICRIFALPILTCLFNRQLVYRFFFTANRSRSKLIRLGYSNSLFTEAFPSSSTISKLVVIKQVNKFIFRACAFHFMINITLKSSIFTPLCTPCFKVRIKYF